MRWCSVCMQEIPGEAKPLRVVRLVGRYAYTLCVCCGQKPRDHKRVHYRSRFRRWVKTHLITVEEPPKQRRRDSVCCTGACGTGTPVGEQCKACHALRRVAVDKTSRLYQPIVRAQKAGLPATLTIEEWDLTLDRFDRSCAYCGAPWVVLEHAQPIALGGGTTADNCLPACRVCNTRKRDTALTALATLKHYPGTKVPVDRVRVKAALVWLKACQRLAVGR